MEVLLLMHLLNQMSRGSLVRNTVGLDRKEKWYF